MRKIHGRETEAELFRRGAPRLAISIVATRSERGLISFFSFTSRQAELEKLISPRVDALFFPRKGGGGGGVGK